MPPKKKNVTSKGSLLSQYLYAIHHQLQYINSSKIFAGLVVVILNISSRFVSIRLSKSVESYLKHTFSRDILIFCIVWMGSRDMYIAFLATIVMAFCIDYLFNENSSLCILPESFTNHHIQLMDKKEPTPEEIENARKILKQVDGEKNNSSSSLYVGSQVPNLSYTATSTSS